MFNAWFILYHKYSRKTYRDREALDAFQRDAEWAGQNNIKLLIIEDYFTCYGEYLSFWSRDTLREMIEIAHKNGIKVLPYTSPSTIDVNSILYRIYGEEWTTKVASPLGGTVQDWAFRSEPGGGLYWRDYRQEPLVWVATCAATSWYDHYLACVRGLLEFGFDGIYIDQHNEGTLCVDHPHVNDSALQMLREMREMVKTDSPERIICANVMSGHPDAHNQAFVERTGVADFGLTESAEKDVRDNLSAWIDRTNLSFFFFSHGSYESHATKVEQARSLGQPVCLFSPYRLEETDPRILRLYEVR